MNSLIGYDSSDEEDDVRPAKPSKIPKTGSTEKANEATVESAPGPSVPEASISKQDLGPAPGPARPTSELNVVTQEDVNIDAPYLSPYTFERQRLRELTMPTVLNFDIPDSPPPPPRNSEEAAALAATTKKFEHFLELKKEGIHFNERLQSSSSLRNPSLLPKLMDFAAISTLDSYKSALPEDIAVPPEWPDQSYAENLLRQNERKEKKRLAERKELDFVSASKPDISSTAEKLAIGSNDERKSKFDKR